jgi:hypothetical protein
MKFIIIFKEDLEIVEVDADNCLLGNLVNCDWHNVPNNDQLCIQASYGGTFEEACILQVVMDDMVDTTQTILNLRSMMMEKKVKNINKIMTWIERIRSGGRQKFPCLQSISTDEEGSTKPKQSASKCSQVLI